MLYPSFQFASSKMEIPPNIECFEVRMQNNIVRIQVCRHGRALGERQYSGIQLISRTALVL